MLDRPRRNRKSEVIRELTGETLLPVKKLIFPLFVIDGKNKKTLIHSMPGIYRFSVDNILKEIDECIQLGISSFVLFPSIEDHLKDKKASYSYAPNNFYLKAIKVIKKRFPEICIVTDVAMDPYSSDGHDGVFQNNEIMNDATLSILGKMSVAQAEAGADILGPSDMMDGRVKYIRAVLDKASFENTSIMSYTAKYASSFYGPFRDALDSAPKKGNKKTYQMDFRNSKEALRELKLDIAEGADMVMVKPALSYLDIIRIFKENSTVPVVAYNVSGEYAMIKAAGAKRWIDPEKAMIETLTSIKRAGADIIISYFAKEYAKLFF